MPPPPRLDDPLELLDAPPQDRYALLELAACAGARFGFPGDLAEAQVAICKHHRAQADDVTASRIARAIAELSAQAALEVHDPIAVRGLLARLHLTPPRIARGARSRTIRDVAHDVLIRALETQASTVCWWMRQKTSGSARSPPASPGNE